MDYLSLHTPDGKNVWIEPQSIITYEIDDYGQVVLVINGGRVTVRESLYEIDSMFNNESAK